MMFPTKHYKSKDGSYEYDYETVGIDHYRTGHIGGELDCGTCDGARCDRCREQWEVNLVDVTDRIPYPHSIHWKRFDNETEAMAYLEKLL